MTITDQKTAEWLYHSGYSLKSCGKALGVSYSSIWRLFKRLDLPRRHSVGTGKDNRFYRGGGFPDKKLQKWAHNKLRSAIRNGTLKREPCEKGCVSVDMRDGRSSVQAHHDDYNKPLEVRWLCVKCHYKEGLNG